MMVYACKKYVNRRKIIFECFQQETLSYEKNIEVETYLLLFERRIHRVLNKSPWCLFQTTVVCSRPHSVYRVHYLSDLCHNRSQIARRLLGTAEQASRSVRNISEHNENTRWSLKEVNNC